MKLSVIIPNYKNTGFLKKNLSLLEKQDFDDYEIIVAEDGGYCEENEETVRNTKNASYIFNEENLGFAATVNNGIAKAEGKYVFLLNNDAFVAKGCLKNLVETFEEESKKRKIFSVQCKMISDQNHEIMDNGGDFYNILGWARVRGKDKKESDYNERKDLFSACAGAALYDREALLSLGGFDENHFAYLEDVDLGYRARLNGYANIYEPASVVYHVGSATSGSRYNEFKVKLAARNSIILRYKNQTVLQKIVNFPFMEAGVIVKQLYFMKKGLGKAYREGIVEGRKLKKNLKNKRVDFKGKHKEVLKLEAEMIRNLRY